MSVIEDFLTWLHKNKGIYLIKKRNSKEELVSVFSIEPYYQEYQKTLLKKHK